MNGWVLLTVIFLGAAVVWAGHSWWWPMRRCPSCWGRSGRGFGSSPRAYNRCHRCKGTGELTRPGAYLIAKATGRPVRGTRKEQ